jgi:2-methylcitrate dehydratase PrpD
MGATRTLSDFVVETDADDLPQDIIPRAKLRVLDTIGAMVIGSERPWSRAVAAFSTGVGGGTGPATVIGSRVQCAPQMAAMANGNMAHAVEIDDVHDESLTHPGAVVIPAAMAVAEEQGASGLEFLCAVVLGYELVGRAGLGVGAVPHMLRGFYPTGTSGVFGAAAAAGKLLRLRSDQMAHALGIAASFAGGIVEYAQTGGVVKWLHAGRAAEAGVTAAYLARSGFTGPDAALEGRFGFCNVFSDAPELHRLLDGLGQSFVMRAITVKPYACCSDMHPVIDAILQLMSRTRIDPSRIRQVEVTSATKLVEFNNIDGSASLMAAKYSVPFTIGLTLTRDISDPAIYHEGILADQELRTIQDKVRMSATPEFDAIYPKIIAARVTVEMEDGSRLTANNFGALGSIHSPLPASEQQAKFLKVTQSVLPQRLVRDIMRRVDTLSMAADIHNLAECLRFQGQTVRAAEKLLSPEPLGALDE